jgi:hypothetical protein
MAWPKDRSTRDDRRRVRPTARRGSLVIEAAISVALLATAAYGLTRLASDWAQLNRQADQRLAATLAAENTRERLRRVTDDRLEEQAVEIAALVAEASGCDIEVSTEPFTHRDREGIHVRVEASPERNTRVTLHDWRLPATRSQQSESSGEETSGSVDSGPVVSSNEVDDE